MKKFLQRGGRGDLIIGGIAIVCLILASERVLPFMPGPAIMLAMAVFVAAFGIFSVLIWRERPRDEREAQIIVASDRWGFLVGASVLAIAVVAQTLRHEPTGVLVAVLIVMILAKLVGKYSQK